VKQSGWDSATIERRTFSRGIKDSAAAANANRGATAPPIPSSDARAFERHRHTNACAFVLGQGWRDDVADCVIVSNSGPVATSTMAAAAQTKPKAALTIPFVKLNTLLN
jgi:hypothetical protein